MSEIKNTITKTYYKKDDKAKEHPIETTYRIDADFVPLSTKEICGEFMTNFCISRGKEDIEWLVRLYDEKITKKTENKKKTETTTKERYLTEREIIQKFAEKYFPTIITDKEKKLKRNQHLSVLKEALEAIEKKETEGTETVEE